MATLPRFPSIDALIGEHSALLTEYMSGKLTEAIPKAKAFVTRAVRTGSILERPTDREAAQSRIDYWSTTLLHGFDISFGDTLLDELDEHELAAARSQSAYSGRRIYESLSEPERELFRFVIGRIAALGKSGEIASRTVAVMDLKKRGDINGILSQLREAGIVRVTARGNPPEEVMEAADPGILGAWPETVKWLEDERSRSEQRQSVRTAAEQWKAHGRDRGGLLAGSLLEQALTYTDLNDLEQEYLRASQASQLSRLRVFIGTLVGSVVLLMIAAGALFHAWQVSDREKRHAEDLLSFKRQMTAKTPPAVSRALQCSGRTSIALEGFYYYASVDGQAAADASTVTYRVEFPELEEPLVVLATSPGGDAPPSEAVWTGNISPKRVIALVEYRDPAHPPIIGACGEIAWKRSR